MKNVMIDIETLGTRPGAAILSIAALYFDLHTGTLGEERCWRVAVKEEDHLHIEPDTVRWWMGQSTPARDFSFGGTGKPLTEVLSHLYDFITCEHDEPFVWAHGASFDPVLITEAAHRIGAGKPPWDFRRLRDTRTLFSLTGFKPQTYFHASDVPHHPLSDCRAQARAVIASYEWLHAIKPIAEATTFRVTKELALACQPSTAENPAESDYQRGYFDGVREYGRAIAALVGPSSKTGEA